MADQSQIDWTLIILFYAAVHYVEAYLAKSSDTHLRSHTTRDKQIALESNLKKVRREYGHLKYYGYNARYEVSYFTVIDVAEARAYFRSFKSVITPLLR